MSFTLDVPSAVPSLFQSSVPWLPSRAVKNRTSPKSVKYEGLEPLAGDSVGPGTGVAEGSDRDCPVHAASHVRVTASVSRAGMRREDRRSVRPATEPPFP